MEQAKREGRGVILVSIPSGTIKIELSDSGVLTIPWFQFHLVRLKYKNGVTIPAKATGFNSIWYD